MTDPHPLARINITSAQIDQVMDSFYARIRQHPTLGPVFIDRIGNDDAVWVEHIAKIGRFWRSTLLHSGGYDGNPMLAHAQVSAIQTEHFTAWLALFDDVLEEMLPAETAAAWSAIAHRIGAALSGQLERMRGASQLRF